MFVSQPYEAPPLLSASAAWIEAATYAAKARRSSSVSSASGFGTSKNPSGRLPDPAPDDLRPDSCTRRFKRELRGRLHRSSREVRASSALPHIEVSAAYARQHEQRPWELHLGRGSGDRDEREAVAEVGGAGLADSTQLLGGDIAAVVLIARAGGPRYVPNKSHGGRGRDRRAPTRSPSRAGRPTVTRGEQAPVPPGASRGRRSAVHVASTVKRRTTAG
jgi:hypothetical protein